MNSYEEILKNNLFNFPDLHTIILFGSARENHTNEESDIDLGIAGKEKFNFSEMQNLQERFMNLFENRNIDLVDLNLSEGLIDREILTKGIVIKEDIHFFLRKLTDMYDYMELYYPILKDDKIQSIKSTFFK
jgi:predicted nucleotidyltransferase